MKNTGKQPADAAAAASASTDMTHSRVTETAPLRGQSVCSDGNAPAVSAALCGAMYRLIQWSDSMLPVGGFAFSCALESAVQMGVVHDAATLQAFTATAVRQSAKGDAIALAHAHTLTHAADWDGLLMLDNAVYTRKLAEEARAMSQRMGRKLLELSADIFAEDATSASAAPAPAGDRQTVWDVVPFARRFTAAVRAGASHGTWPVAQGVVFAAVGLDKAQALAAHQYSVAATVLNAALRLMRITHVQTQRILSRLTGEIGAQCCRAAAASLGQMCAFAPMTDILGAVHTRAHVRLFMS